MMTALALVCGLLSLAGAAQALVARGGIAWLLGRPCPDSPARPVSLLKPLHGDEPGLRASLDASLSQHHAAPFEVLFSTSAADDAARPVAQAAMAASPTTVALMAAAFMSLRRRTW